MLTEISKIAHNDNYFTLLQRDYGFNHVLLFVLFTPASLKYNPPNNIISQIYNKTKFNPSNNKVFYTYIKEKPETHACST